MREEKSKNNIVFATQEPQITDPNELDVTDEPFSVPPLAFIRPALTAAVSLVEKIIDYTVVAVAESF